jgi:cytochrome P450/pimeloyl-ACP methyl ester carboxylesterase
VTTVSDTWSGTITDPPVASFILDTTRGPVDAITAVPTSDVDLGVPVVLCAGLVGSKEDFLPLMPALALAGYRPYAFDYRGHYSPTDHHSVEEHTVERHATDLLAILAAIEDGRPAHVLGHSFGGFVVRAAALAQPRLMRSVTLMGNGPSMNSERHRSALERFDATLALEGRGVMWPVVRRLIPENDIVRRQFWQSRIDGMQPAFLHGVLRSLRAEADRGAELRATNLPVLIVHGHRDRRMWSTVEYTEYAERLGAAHESVANASHSPILEQPATTAEALVRFWAATDHRFAVKNLFDLVRPRALADPYPLYTRLRETAPVLRVQLPGTSTAFVLTRYADCVRLLREPAFHSAGEAPEQVAPRWRDDRLIRCLYQSFGFRDGPAHDLLRATVARALTPHRSDLLRADTERIADQLLDDLERRLGKAETVDLVDAIAVPFASLVIGRLLDIPDAEALRLGRAGRAASAAFEPFMTPRQRTRMTAAGDTLIESLTSLAARPRDAGCQDLLSVVRANRPTGGEPYLGDLVLLFGAGYDSPASLVTLGARLLLEHPDQARILREDPSAIEPCIEEILRYDPPIQLVMRVATEPKRFGHTDIPPGAPVLGLVAAANRDPAYVTDPERFVVTRRPTSPSLSFGAGPHYCPGAALARMQAQILFPRLVSRFPRLRMAGTPRYRSPGTMLRGLEYLPVALAP